MKDKADCFDEMVEHEEKIRLGEAGWRERYYEASWGITGLHASTVACPTRGARPRPFCLVAALCVLARICTLTTH